MHPAIAVKEQERLWASKWSQSPASDLEALSQLLHHVPQPQSVAVDFQVSADDLRRQVRSMKSKAAGPDSWAAKKVYLMPSCWWQHVANLWNRVICLGLGVVPEQWAKAKVILLWKKTGKTRPISLFSIIWRAGAKALTSRLKDWCGSWTTCFDAGGLPRMSVSGALMQLQLGLHSGVGLIAQQDIATFFDSIHLDIVEAVLRHLHAPHASDSLLLQPGTAHVCA